MKRWFTVLMVLAALALPLMGCATLGGGNWNDNVPQLKQDVAMFSTIATRLLLNEADMSSEDVGIIRGYLVALRDLLAVPGEPNFDGAKILVGDLPQKYQVYGFSIINLIERYVFSANLDVTENQEDIIGIIFAAIDGALEAVGEFSK